MNTSPFLRTLARGLMAAAVLALAACGGGGGGGGGGTTIATGGIIGGTGFKGPVANATVTAYAVSGGSSGVQIVRRRPTPPASSACRSATIPGR